MRLNHFMFTCASLMASALMLTSCIDRYMAGFPRYMSNEGYSVYVLNYTGAEVKVKVDEEEMVVEPTEKPFSDLSAFERAWREEVYDGDEKSSGVFFFSEDDSENYQAFPIDMSDEDFLFCSHDSPTRVEVEREGEVVFASGIKQNLSEKNLFTTSDFIGIQLPYSRLRDGAMLFSPETDGIIILGLWRLEGYSSRKKGVDGTAALPRYVLVVPPSEAGE